MRVPFRFFVLLVAACLVLSACAADPTPAPTEAPTAAPTAAATATTAATAAAEPTAEPTATAAAAVISAQDILIPHPIEGQEACESCHGPDGVLPNPPDHAGWDDENCQYCHQPADAPDSAPDVSAFTQVECLACHGPFADLAALDVAAEADDGSEVNPHVFVPHDSDTIAECSSCHQPHSLPPNASELAEQPQPSLESCYECHHTRNFMNCTSCHAIVPSVDD